MVIVQKAFCPGFLDVRRFMQFLKLQNEDSEDPRFGGE